VTNSGRDKNREKNNPGSAICQANKEMRAICGEK